jgi:hypothetical protein
VVTRVPLRIDARLLALAAAMRVFARYPVIDRLTVAAGTDEVAVSRDEVTRLLGPEGFAGIEDRARYRMILADALGADAGGAR